MITNAIMPPNKIILSLCVLLSMRFITFLDNPKVEPIDLSLSSIDLNVSLFVRN